MVNENHLNIALRRNLTKIVMVVTILVTVQSFLLQLSDLINLIESVVNPRTLPVHDELPCGSAVVTEQVYANDTPVPLTNWI